MWRNPSAESFILSTYQITSHVKRERCQDAGALTLRGHYLYIGTVSSRLSLPTLYKGTAQVIKILALRRDCHQLRIQSITMTEILSCQRPNAFITYQVPQPGGRRRWSLMQQALQQTNEETETDWYPKYKYKYSTGSEMISI